MDVFKARSVAQVIVNAVLTLKDQRDYVSSMKRTDKNGNSSYKIVGQIDRFIDAIKIWSV